MKYLQAYAAYVFRVFLFFVAISVLSLDIACAAQLTLHWTDRATNEAGFNVERKLGSTGTFVQVAAVGTNVTSYVDASLAASTTYCYRVRAFNSAGNSTYSNAVCGTTLALKYRLSGSLMGSGALKSSPSGINCPADCIEDYASGTQVALTPSPTNGWAFASWGGGCTGQGIPCRLTMSAIKNVTVNFAQNGASIPTRLWGALAIGGTTADTPTITAFGGALWLVIRGTNNSVYSTRLTTSGWGAWQGLGGTTLSAPAAVEFNNKLWVFIRGGDNRIYLKQFNGTTWTGWSVVPGGGTTPSGPRLVVFNNQLHLFIRGSDNRVYLNRFSGTVWTGWSVVPGGVMTIASPTVSVFQNALYLVVLGTNNHLYYRKLTSVWSSWVEVPGNGSAAGTLASSVFNGRLSLFVRGGDSRIYQNHMSIVGSWSGWSQVSGNGLSPSGPGAAATTSAQYLAIRGMDSRIYVSKQ
jgi:Divergent InlB B-repeat domain